MHPKQYQHLKSLSKSRRITVVPVNITWDIDGETVDLKWAFRPQWDILRRVEGTLKTLQVDNSTVFRVFLGKCWFSVCQRLQPPGSTHTLVKIVTLRHIPT